MGIVLCPDSRLLLLSGSCVKSVGMGMRLAACDLAQLKQHCRMCCSLLTSQQAALNCLCKRTTGKHSVCYVRLVFLALLHLHDQRWCTHDFVCMCILISPLEQFPFLPHEPCIYTEPSKYNTLCCTLLQHTYSVLEVVSVLL